MAFSLNLTDIVKFDLSWPSDLKTFLPLKTCLLPSS